MISHLKVKWVSRELYNPSIHVFRVHSWGSLVIVFVQRRGEMVLHFDHVWHVRLEGFQIGQGLLHFIGAIQDVVRVYHAVLLNHFWSSLIKLAWFSIIVMVAIPLALELFQWKYSLILTWRIEFWILILQECAFEQTAPSHYSIGDLHRGLLLLPGCNRLEPGPFPAT